MQRRDFLQAAFPLTALSALCAACQKDAATDPNNNGANTGPVVNNDFEDFDVRTQLLQPGEFISRRGVLIIRIAANNDLSAFQAFSNVCPHAGGQLQFEAASNQVWCPVHGSRFTAAGQLLLGPAATGLTTLRTEWRFPFIRVWLR
ncbi:MAG: Rieske (2Fe-2S) protein [Chitinophagaceae bacterium]|nr:Rieske (2Fe-2S) protein [Chitinophagaceae bacterium]